MHPPCPASPFILRVCLKERTEGRERKNREKGTEKGERCTVHSQTLNVQDEGSCYCLLKVVKESDSMRGSEVGGLWEMMEARSTESCRLLICVALHISHTVRFFSVWRVISEGVGQNEI